MRIPRCARLCLKGEFMASNLEAFTQRAQRVLQLAQEEAELMHLNYIGTEHVLLGLVREEHGIAGNVLRGIGATPERVKILVYQMVGSGKRLLTSGPLELTPHTKQVIEFAVDEARSLNHAYIGPEHLLLAVVRQKEGIALDVLSRIGQTCDSIRQDVLRAIANGTPDDSIASLSSNVPGTFYPRKPIKLGLTNEAKTAIDDVLNIFDTGNSDLISRLGEYARQLLVQRNEPQDKPE